MAGFPPPPPPPPGQYRPVPGTAIPRPSPQGGAAPPRFGAPASAPPNYGGALHHHQQQQQHFQTTPPPPPPPPPGGGWSAAQPNAVSQANRMGPPPSLGQPPPPPRPSSSFGSLPAEGRSFYPPPPGPQMKIPPAAHPQPPGGYHQPPSPSGHSFQPPPPPGHAYLSIRPGVPPPPQPVGSGMPLRPPPPGKGVPPPPPLSCGSVPPPPPLSHGALQGVRPAYPPPPPGQFQGQQQNPYTTRGHTPPPKQQQHQNPYTAAGLQGSYGHGPPQQQQQPHAPAPPPPSREIDPSLLPRVPLFTRPQDEPAPVFYPKASVGQCPPPADSRFWVKDDGNASPELIRSTLYNIPSNRVVWHNSGDLPMGVVCSPLAVHSQDFSPPPREIPVEDEDHELMGGVPLVVPPQEGPPRCAQCLAYVNPFFHETGKCNFCGSLNRNIMAPGSVDATTMQCGTVDYQVSGPYVIRKTPVKPLYLYALDLTNPHAANYLDVLERLGQALATHVQRQSGSSYQPKLGLALFCSAGFLVRNKAILSPDNPGRYACMTDMTAQPFCPLPLEDWTYAMEEWPEFLEQVRGDMDMLKKLARAKNCHGLDGLELSCGGAAAACLADALRETGGRGVILTWRRPNFGVGAIPFREQNMAGGVVQGAYTTSTPLQFQSSKGDKKSSPVNHGEFYTKLGAECVKTRVALDLVMHTSPAVDSLFLDLASLGELCRQTCGHLHWICSHNWEENLFQELRRQIQSIAVSDAVFKLRCSTGLQVKTYYPGGGGTVVGGDLGVAPEVDLPWASSSTHIAVELEHRVGGIQKEAKHAYLQSALLYTTLSGSRRVRVSTLCLRTTSSVTEVYPSVDFGATITFFLRGTIARMYKPQPHATDAELELTRSSAREALYHKTVLVLANYRQYTQAANAPSTQLVLPETMQLFPLFCMSLLKSVMLRPCTAHRLADSSQRLTPTGDERAFFMWQAMRAHPAMAMTLAHPTVFPLRDNKDDRVGEWRSGEGYGFVRLPDTMVASMATSLNDDGVYFIDNGISVYFVVGKDAPEEFRKGWDAVVSQDPKIERILWQIRRGASHRPTYTHMITVLLQERHQGKREMEVLNLMFDDAVCGERDLSGFLINLHQTIRQRLDGTTKK